MIITWERIFRAINALIGLEFVTETIESWRLIDIVYGNRVTVTRNCSPPAADGVELIVRTISLMKLHMQKICYRQKLWYINNIRQHRARTLPQVALSMYLFPTSTHRSLRLRLLRCERLLPPSHYSSLFNSISYVSTSCISINYFTINYIFEIFIKHAYYSPLQIAIFWYKFNYFANYLNF